VTPWPKQPATNLAGWPARRDAPVLAGMLAEAMVVLAHCPPRGSGMERAAILGPFLPGPGVTVRDGVEN
jgi:hypothetical protein